MKDLEGREKKDKSPSYHSYYLCVASVKMSQQKAGASLGKRGQVTEEANQCVFI